MNRSIGYGQKAMEIETQLSAISPANNEVSEKTTRLEMGQYRRHRQIKMQSLNLHFGSPSV